MARVLQEYADDVGSLSEHRTYFVDGRQVTQPVYHLVSAYRYSLWRARLTVWLYGPSVVARIRGKS